MHSDTVIPPSFKMFLIGMPGAGKTWWGRRIAKEFHLQFVDLDDYIENKEKASISTLFAAHKEGGFREREHEHLKNIISDTHSAAIIACGGGTPCFCGNIHMMKEAGVVVYLDADIPTLESNVSHNREIRPLLAGKEDIAAHLAELLQQRQQFYTQADFILQVKDITLATFAQIIASCTNRH